MDCTKCGKPVDNQEPWMMCTACIESVLKTINDVYSKIDSAQSRRSMWPPVAEDHCLLVHWDGSPCPDGCDQSAHPDLQEAYLSGMPKPELRQLADDITKHTILTDYDTFMDMAELDQFLSESGMTAQQALQNARSPYFKDELKR